MINLFVVFSQIEKKSSVEKRTKSTVDFLINEISSLKFKGFFSNPKQINEFLSSSEEIINPSIIINSSGGTESVIDSFTRKLNLPILVLADSKRNSFASSLEAYAFLKNEFSIKIFYAETESEKFEEAKKFARAIEAVNLINNTNFGLIGEPSNWLLTSQNFNGFGDFETKITKIEIDKLVSKVNEVSSDDSKEIVEKWKKTYSAISVNEKSLFDSARVYLALKNLVEDYKLSSLSVRCFDLLQHNYTACMGISLCNDEGITSGCEGDLPATFTMMIAQQLTGRPAWMANPSSVNKEKNEVIFAHCTVPSSFLADKAKAGLTTHMESGLSTAIRGPLRNSEVTIIRMGSDFKSITIVKGKIQMSDMQDENLCRTQAVIKLESDVNKWIESVLGNHQIIVYGDINRELAYFCEFAKVKLIQI